MKKFFGIITSLVIAVSLGLSTVQSTPVLALGEGGAQGGVGAAKGDGVPTNFANGDNSIIKNIINTMLYAIGILSVIMLIFGGFRYVTSSGNKDAVTAAKNTILYAIIGLLVALFAYAIIRFVLNIALDGGTGTNV